MKNKMLFDLGNMMLTRGRFEAAMYLPNMLKNPRQSRPMKVSRSR